MKQIKFKDFSSKLSKILFSLKNNCLCFEIVIFPRTNNK